MALGQAGQDVHLVGLALGAKAPPDGYTLIFGTSAGLAVNPALGVKMPFDPVRDFEPIGLMTYVPYLLVVHPDVPARTVKELVDLARANPGKLNFVAAGVNNISHLAPVLLFKRAGVELTPWPG